MKLEVRELRKSFGGIAAVNGVSFVAEDATITTVLGPNGAGKTTLFNVITGVVPASGGSVRAGEREILGLSAYAVARHGVVRTFQKIRLFGRLTAQENVAVAVLSASPCGWFKAMLGRSEYRLEMQAADQRAMELLALVGLSGRAMIPSIDLPQGERRLLEVARAIAVGPEVLLLDEPMAGLNGEECQAIADVAAKLRDGGITIVMIEHHVDHALSVSDQVVVVNFGTKIFDGPPREARNSNAVRAAYLGGAEAEEAAS